MLSVELSCSRMTVGLIWTVQVVGLCLAGFVAAIRVTSLLDMAMLRNTFVTSLARFTNLHAPASMEPKSAKAFRALLFVADDIGNHLHVRCCPVVLCPPAPDDLIWVGLQNCSSRRNAVASSGFCEVHILLSIGFMSCETTTGCPARMHISELKATSPHTPDAATGGLAGGPALHIPVRPGRAGPLGGVAVCRRRRVVRGAGVAHRHPRLAAPRLLQQRPPRQAGWCA